MRLTAVRSMTGIKEEVIMKALAINGSARKDGNTAILINAVLEELNKEGIETEMV